MKSFVDFSENLEDKKQQLMQKQKVMQQMERERASRSNQEFQQDKEEKQSRMDQEKEEEKRLEQIKKEIKKEIKQEMEVDEEFGKMTKKQTQAYSGMDDKEQKALYKKMKKDGYFDVKKNLAGAVSDDKDMSEESNPRIPRKKGQPANSKKHSDLYTDENPKGTIHGLGFKDVATAKASVSKIRNSSRSHAHKIQAAVAMEQRAREMGKTSEAAVYRKFINSMKKKTKKMNEAVSMKDTKKLKKAAALDLSKNPKDWESARARRTEIDFKDLMRQRKEKQKGLKKEEVSTPKYKNSDRDMQLSLIHI